MNIGDRFKKSTSLLFRSRFHYFRMAMVHPPFWLSVNRRTCKVFASNDPGAITCYAEVIIEDCYDLLKYSKRITPSTIVDIGANVGVFSRFCSLLFPNADIYAYEPNPSALMWLNRNAEATNITVFPYGVAKEAGMAKIDSECDSTISVVGRGNLSVKCIAASEVATGISIDLLKMDCEGSEWAILQDTNLLQRTQHFCLEYHLYENHTVGELKELVEKAGHCILRICPKEEYNGKFGLLWSTRTSTIQ